MNRLIILVFLFSSYLLTAYSQTKDRTGSIYLYWGWNHAQYTKSDITFSGNDYSFKLYDVKAHDRQTHFGSAFFNPGEMTIPQYNFRLGYFFHNNWNVSFGIDHMKYVMDQNQTVNITGSIDNGSAFNGRYNGDQIKLTEDFLTFEHTDGLNYANFEIRRFDNIRHFPISKNGKGIGINVTEGLGAGILYPKTNAKLMENARNDKFHLAGFGTSGIVGLNINFWEHFFVQAELKGGFVNMPSIRTTSFRSDKAKQHFFYLQENLVFGTIFPVFKHRQSS